MKRFVIAILLLASLACGSSASGGGSSGASPTRRPYVTATPIPGQELLGGGQGSTTGGGAATAAPTAAAPSNTFKPGTYLVGSDIQPGIYEGKTADSCYWSRLKDVSGSLDSILANDNSVGQFYIEVVQGDYALKIGCEIAPMASVAKPAAFLTSLPPGTYLIGRDIEAGTFKGQAGSDTCYWARLKNVNGGVDSIIANDNSNGQYFIQVSADDFALTVKCQVDRAN